MRHTSGICSCPKQGEDMTGKDPLDCPEFGFDRRAFRDDRGMFPQGLKPNANGPLMSELKLRPPKDGRSRTRAARCFAPYGALRHAAAGGAAGPDESGRF